jgi:hypothetical protein
LKPTLPTGFEEPTLISHAAKLLQVGAHQGFLSDAFVGHRRPHNSFAKSAWTTLIVLMDRALTLPEMQLALEDAALAYREF